MNKVIKRAAATPLSEMASFAERLALRVLQGDARSRADVPVAL